MRKLLRATSNGRARLIYRPSRPGVFLVSAASLMVPTAMHAREIHDRCARRWLLVCAFAVDPPPRGRATAGCYRDPSFPCTPEILPSHISLPVALGAD